jgi:hypothetical protein
MEATGSVSRIEKATSKVEKRKSESVARVEQETGLWQQRLTKLEAGLEQAKAQLREAQERRDALLLESMENEPGKGKLAAARADVLEAANAVEETERSIAKVREKLADLGKAHTLAERRAKEAERAELSARQLELAGELDKALAVLAEKGEQWLDVTLQIYQRTSDLGESMQPPKRLFFWALATKLKGLCASYIDSPLMRLSFTEASGRFAGQKDSTPSGKGGRKDNGTRDAQEPDVRSDRAAGQGAASR